MTPFALFYFIVASGIYTVIVYALGKERGRQGVYEAALDVQRRYKAGEDLGLEACLEKNSRSHGGKFFTWGSEALPGLKFYGCHFMGFQIGYWDKKW